MDHIIRFKPSVAKEVNEHVRLATKIWRDAKPDFKSLPPRITAGNYAGYGRYAAICHGTGVIEFPVGNDFSRLELSGNLLDYSNQEEFLGTLLHELGHHVVNTARVKPWEGLKHGGQTTHVRSEWIWICRTAWIHFHGDSPSHDDLATALKDSRRPEVLPHFRSFNPYSAPPEIAPVDKSKLCDECGESFTPKRSDAKFCSTKCRVYAKRKRDK